MIWFRNRAFTCDECPICNGIEHRLQTAAVIGGEPQFEYCWCDKVQDEFYIGGYCSDAFSRNTQSHRKHGARKTGSAYRRRMRQQKKGKRMQIMTYGYNPAAGYTDWETIDGVFQPVCYDANQKNTKGSGRRFFCSDRNHAPQQRQAVLR